MYSMCKIIRSSANPLSKHIKEMPQRTSGSGRPSGSGNDKKGNDHSEPSLVFPCCACPSDYNPSTPTMYECRKYGHCLPSNDVRPPFDAVLNVPTGIFRCTAGEKLGPGADKCECYQCAEYFSYHNMTYYDMHLILRAVRGPSANTGRKP